MTNQRPDLKVILTLYASDQCQSFLKQLAERRDELDRLIFAEWLEEHSLDAEAAGQRWAAATHRWPVPEGSMPTLFGGGWYTEDASGKEIPSWAKLPMNIFWPNQSWAVMSEYSNIREGFDCEAWFLNKCSTIIWENDQPIRTRYPYGLTTYRQGILMRTLAPLPLIVNDPRILIKDVS